MNFSNSPFGIEITILSFLFSTISITLTCISAYQARTRVDIRQPYWREEFQSSYLFYKYKTSDDIFNDCILVIYLQIVNSSTLPLTVTDINIKYPFINIFKTELASYNPISCSLEDLIGLNQRLNIKSKENNCKNDYR